MGYFSDEDIRVVEDTIENILRSLEVESPAIPWLLGEQEEWIEEARLSEYLI